MPVFEGTDDLTLNRGAGRIIGTARLGGSGNIGIAAHRDGFFRSFKDIREGDEIDLGTAGQMAAYLVDSIKIVTPDDVSVLRTGTSIIDPGDMLPLLFRRKCTESLNCPGFSQYPK